jgi:hypothetical protein
MPCVRNSPAPRARSTSTTAAAATPTTTRANTIWKYRPGGKDIGEAKGKAAKRLDPDPYQTEHDTLQAAIRDNKPLNNAYYGAESTMTAIMGRMATYSGKELKWDEVLNSKVQHMPAIITPESEPPVKTDAEWLVSYRHPRQGHPRRSRRLIRQPNSSAPAAVMRRGFFVW